MTLPLSPVTCSVPDLDDGTSNPIEGTTVSTSTAITISCSSGYDTGYNNHSQYKCEEEYACFKKCSLPELTSTDQVGYYGSKDLCSKMRRSDPI